MADNNLIELFNDIGYTRSDSISRYLKTPQQMTKTGVFLDKNGQPTDRFLQSLKAENSSSSNGMTSSANLEHNFIANDYVNEDDSELELDYANNNSKEVLQNAHKSPNLVEYSTMVSSANKALMRTNTSLPNRKPKKNVKILKKKQSNSRLSFDEPILIPTTSKYDTLINNKLEKMVYNTSNNEFLPDPMAGDSNIIQTLKLRVKGQLHTIRVLESQLSDSLHLLEARNIEVTNLKKRLQQTDRKDRMMVRDEYKHLQTIRSEDIMNNLHKYKTEIETLTNKLTNEQNRRLQTESRNKTYRENIEKYKAVNIESDNKIQALEQSLTDLQQLIKRNKKEEKGITNEILTYQSVIEKLKLSCEQFEKNNKKLTASLSQANNEIESLKEIHSKQKLDLETTLDQLKRVTLELDVIKDIQNTRAIERRVLHEGTSNTTSNTTSIRKDGADRSHKIHRGSGGSSGGGSSNTMKSDSASGIRELTGKYNIGSPSTGISPAHSHKSYRRDQEPSVTLLSNNKNSDSYRSKSVGPGIGQGCNRLEASENRSTSSLGRFMEAPSSNSNTSRISGKPLRPSSAGALSSKYAPSPRPETMESLQMSQHPTRTTATSSDLPRRLIDRHINNNISNNNSYHRDPSSKISLFGDTQQSTRNVPFVSPQQVLDNYQDSNDSYSQQQQLQQQQQQQQQVHRHSSNKSLQKPRPNQISNNINDDNNNHEANDYLMNQSQSFLDSRQQQRQQQQQQQQQQKHSDSQVIHIREKNSNNQHNSQKIIIQKVNDDEDEEKISSNQSINRRQLYRKPPPSSPSSDNEIITRKNKTSKSGMNVNNNTIFQYNYNDKNIQQQQGVGGSMIRSNVSQIRPFSASTIRPASQGNNLSSLSSLSKTKLSPSRNSNNKNVIKTSSKFDRLQKMYARVTGSSPAARVGRKDSDSDSDI